VISETGNFFFELITDIQRDKKGWATYTEADYIFYGDAQNRLFYIFPALAMKDFLQQHIGEYETSIAKDYDKRTGEVKKESLGAKVPISLFRKYVKVETLDIAERLAQR